MERCTSGRGGRRGARAERGGAGCDYYRRWRVLLALMPMVAVVVPPLALMPVLRVAVALMLVVVVMPLLMVVIVVVVVVMVGGVVVVVLPAGSVASVLVASVAAAERVRENVQKDVSEHRARGEAEQRRLHVARRRRRHDGQDRRRRERDEEGGADRRGACAPHRALRREQRVEPGRRRSGFAGRLRLCRVGEG